MSLWYPLWTRNMTWVFRENAGGVIFRFLLDWSCAGSLLPRSEESRSQFVLCKAISQNVCNIFTKTLWTNWQRLPWHSHNFHSSGHTLFYSVVRDNLSELLCKPAGSGHNHSHHGTCTCLKSPTRLKEDQSCAHCHCSKNLNCKSLTHTMGFSWS